MGKIIDVYTVISGLGTAGIIKYFFLNMRELLEWGAYWNEPKIGKFTKFIDFLKEIFIFVALIDYLQQPIRSYLKAYNLSFYIFALVLCSKVSFKVDNNTYLVKVGT